jgi:hypothetical protein
MLMLMKCNAIIEAKHLRCYTGLIKTKCQFGIPPASAKHDVTKSPTEDGVGSPQLTILTANIHIKFTQMKTKPSNRALN